jgi:hypothetical protein
MASRQDKDMGAHLVNRRGFLGSVLALPLALTVKPETGVQRRLRANARKYRVRFIGNPHMGDSVTWSVVPSDRLHVYEGRT